MCCPGSSFLWGLKEELDIPAVGDLGKVLLAMANVDEDFVRLLGYRFGREGTTLYNHPVRNVMLAALIDLKGSLTEASKYMSNIMKVKGSVLPLTEEKVELIGVGEGRRFIGQCEVSQNIKDIDHLEYDRPFEVSREILEKIYEADLIVFSPGSLYTSIIPHLIAPDVRKAIGWSHAPIMYISNLVSQAGETDGFTVSDHVRALNKYLGERKVDVVIANNGRVDPAVSDIYEAAENKHMVELDSEAVSDLGTEIIADDICVGADGRIRHDELKTAYMVFSYLMRNR